MKHPVKINERSMLALEARIPELAGSAVKRAYYQALSTSGTVKEAINGQLLETSADGAQRVIRNLPMPMAIALGSKRVRTRSK
jgi:hypothetical protein